MPLESLDRSMAMDIVAFFAVRHGEKGELLERQFLALFDQAEFLPDGAARSRNAVAPQGRRVTKAHCAR